MIQIPRESARGAVLAQVRRWIEDGILEPREVIKDAEIAARLGVSRTPVREALQILEQQGLIESVPGRYTRVSSASVDDARLVYPPLAVLQALAAELATEKIDAADLGELEAANRDLAEAVEAGDPLGARDADTAFHRLVVERAENPVLNQSIENLLIHVRRLEALYFRQIGPAHESHEQHTAIIEAVRRGDSAAASELTRANFLRTWQPQDGTVT